MEKRVSDTRFFVVICFCPKLQLVFAFPVGISGERIGDSGRFSGEPASWQVTKGFDCRVASAEKSQQKAIALEDICKRHKAWTKRTAASVGFTTWRPAKRHRTGARKFIMNVDNQATRVWSCFDSPLPSPSPHLDCNLCAVATRAGPLWPRWGCLEVAWCAEKVFPRGAALATCPLERPRPPR